MAVRHYFLGANTGGGFVSVYDEFCPPESETFLWVLKGGPGCGKSSFMKAIGRATGTIVKEAPEPTPQERKFDNLDEPIDPTR